MSLSNKFIAQDWAAQGALALHEVALLDFLNAVKTPGELNKSVIKDDPGRFSSRNGYGIGETVARRIIEKRDEIGRFNSLNQLMDIKGFGEDKFHDLVYTFVEFIIPLPSGRGIQFDNFITALGALERAYTGPTSGFVTAVRKLFHQDSTGAIPIDLDWGEILPNSTSNIPAVWASTEGLRNAVNFIISNPEVRIDKIPVNVHTLLTGMDAVLHNRSITPLDNRLSFDSNTQYATYLNPLSQVLFRYAEDNNVNFADPTTVLQEDKLKTAFLINMTFGQFYAAADAFAMEIDPQRALVWNLLYYYTEEGSPIKQRFDELVEVLGLGSYSQGRFTDQAVAFPAIQHDVLHSFLNIGQQNGRHPVEINALLGDSTNTEAATGLNTVASYTTDLFLDILAFLIASQSESAAVLTWNRLEGRPHTQDFERPLQAAIRDPLWMLCRQYQLGEFKGEDTGSPIETRLKTKSSQLDHVALGHDKVITYQDSAPLEMLVEQVPVSIGVMTKLEMAQQWNRMLRQHFNNQSLDEQMGKTISTELSAAFPLVIDETDELLVSEPGAWATLSLMKQSNQFDGFAFYTALTDGMQLSDLTTVNDAGINQLGITFVDWSSKEIIAETTQQSKAWNASHLEYQFACSAPRSANTNTLVAANEYANGDLDWYAFDFINDVGDYDPALKPSNPDIAAIKTEVQTLIPSQLSYPGMPVPRWWQMEDYAINFDQLTIDKSDAASLAFAEFATIYSNDWLLIPFQLSHGSICEVESMVVKDVFGQYTRIQPAGGSDPLDWQRWAMFDLHQSDPNASIADHRLFLPPTLARSLQSEAVEKINFLKDEMANMVWALEMQIPDAFYGGRDAYQAGLNLRRIIKDKVDPNIVEPVNTLENEATIKYQLGSEVPENWIPFIPVKKAGDPKRMIQLQRAAMPRIIPGLPTKRIRPRTALLQVNHEPDAAQAWKPYYIFEEEIPRSGVMLTKAWQRTRWYNGKTFVWLGNRKQNGRGQANSGLSFDNVIDRG